MSINASKYTRHLNHGKFEGETPATEYFYEHMLDGDGEDIFAFSEGDDDEGFEGVPYANLFHINSEEAEAFDLPIGHWFLLHEDSQGFVYGSTHETREAAEAKFRDWLGL